LFVYVIYTALGVLRYGHTVLMQWDLMGFYRVERSLYVVNYCSCDLNCLSVPQVHVQ